VYISQKLWVVDVTEDSTRMKLKLVANEHGLNYLPSFLTRSATGSSIEQIPEAKPVSTATDLEKDNSNTSAKAVAHNVQAYTEAADNSEDDEGSPLKQSLRLANR
jgi:hypothetical protein